MQVTADTDDGTADMNGLQALIFDVDGTLADTEEIHRQAFNRAFAEFGIPWDWTPALYERLLSISGGRERIDAYMRELLAEGPGEILTPDFIRELHALETLLDMNLPADWRGWFDAIESCDTVPLKKPSPAVYLAALRALDLPASACIAFEDTLNGLLSARGALLVTVITTHRYTQARHFPGAALVTDGLGEPDAPCSVLHGSLAEETCVNLAALRRLLAGASGGATQDAAA